MIYQVTNAYYFRYLNKIGGIESHLYYLAKKYGRYDIAILYREGDPQQVNRLKKYVRCIKVAQENKVICDNLFCCFNRDILDQVEAKTKYLVLHGDYKDMLERNQIKKEDLPIDSRIDKYLGVSQLVCDSWEEVSGIKAETVYEPVVLDEVKRPLLFVSATRLTKEKGWERMKQLARSLNMAGVNYIWLIFTDSPKEPEENMYFLKPRLDITDKLEMFDAFIQLSDNEGYCLSVVEALLRGVPVIATPLPVFKEIGLNDTNSIFLDFTKELPISEIENIHKKKEIRYNQIKDKWAAYIKPVPTTYEGEKKMKVKATDAFRTMNVVDSEVNRIREEGEVFEVSEERANVLLGANPYKIPFVKVIEEEPKAAAPAPDEVKEEPKAEAKPKKGRKPKAN